MQVFAEKGFRARGCRTSRAAGVADGTIYLYFRNKEDLLLTIFEEKVGEILVRVHRALEGVEGPVARIHAFARFHFTPSPYPP